jgi:hypothetical protein
MPALVAGIHLFLCLIQKGVDGRVKPGHDEAPRSGRVVMPALVAGIHVFL